LIPYQLSTHPISGKNPHLSMNAGDVMSLAGKYFPAIYICSVALILARSAMDQQWISKESSMV